MSRWKRFLDWLADALIRGMHARYGYFYKNEKDKK
jgi:hypothetical protein